MHEEPLRRIAAAVYDIPKLQKFAFTEVVLVGNERMNMDGSGFRIDFSRRHEAIHADADTIGIPMIAAVIALIERRPAARSP